jgi:uncharacterized protein YndB with AHSA1/START domain
MASPCKWRGLRPGGSSPWCRLRARASRSGRLSFRPSAYPLRPLVLPVCRSPVAGRRPARPKRAFAMGTSIAPLTTMPTPPTRLLDAVIHLRAPASEVFALIGDHRALPRWVPGVRRVVVDDSRAESPGGVGARRTLHMVLGPAGEEVVTTFVPPVRLRYSATDESLRGLCRSHTAELSCVPTERGTRLRWIVDVELPVSLWRRAVARALFWLVCSAGLRRLEAQLGGRA